MQTLLDSRQHLSPGFPIPNRASNPQAKKKAGPDRAAAEPGTPVAQSGSPDQVAPLPQARQHLLRPVTLPKRPNTNPESLTAHRRR